MISRQIFLAIIAAWMFAVPVLAQQEDSEAGEVEQVRKYRTREERRKAGLKFAVNEWTTISGLLESEYLYQRASAEDEPSHTSEDEFSAELQLGLEMTPLSWAKIELVYEYDAATNEQILDEAIAGFEGDDFDLEVGMLYPPFGEYFSHFVTGALLEFGETRDPGAVLSYTPKEELDVSVFVYNGKAERADPDAGKWDWGFSAEFSPLKSTTVALSFLSDLADSEERLLKDHNDTYEIRVPALSGYVLVGHGPFEVTGEFVHALRAFEELDEEFNMPAAWNIELAYYPQTDLEVAFRYEGSKDLEDAPQSRVGAGFTWRVIRNVYVSLEYLYGRFEEPRSAHYFGTRISIL